MSLIQYEPSALLSRLYDDINQLFRSTSPWQKFRPIDDSSIATAEWMPAVNIQEKDDKFIISADVPGVEPEEVKVDMKNGMLSIHGERKSEVDKEENGFRRVECTYGAFHRRFSLPESADVEKIKAKAKNGVLEITIGKRETVKPKAVKIEH